MYTLLCGGSHQSRFEQSVDPRIEVSVELPLLQDIRPFGEPSEQSIDLAHCVPSDDESGAELPDLVSSDHESGVADVTSDESESEPGPAMHRFGDGWYGTSASM